MELKLWSERTDHVSGTSFTTVRDMRGRNIRSWRGKTFKPASVVSYGLQGERGLQSEAGRKLCLHIPWQTAGERGSCPLELSRMEEVKSRDHSVAAKWPE